MRTHNPSHAIARSIAIATTVLLLVASLVPLVAGEREGALIDFNRDIRPILSNRCFKCHGQDANQRKGGIDGLRLDVQEEAFSDLGGYAAIVPEELEQSELILRITAEDSLGRMPPTETGKRLTDQEIELLTEWIRQGARYAEHWSYVKPVRPPLPAVSNTSWPRNAVDYFILARLEREGLNPSPEADRTTLIRRLSLDLTGLPPTLDEVLQFVSDTTLNAYEKLVDRLLANPAYGEHWARMWLDLARYADSAGYADDPPRTIWAYRDYVIRAFNANKPFDQFTLEQLAGDLLPEATEEQLVATAFHRNTLTNNEGGTDDEEFRNVAVVDRVDTTMAVWMATTIGCAQCHDHKYDPITQDEYFRFFGFFNNTADADRRDEGPLLELYFGERKRQKAEWQAKITGMKEALRRPETDSKPLGLRLFLLEKQLAALKPDTTVPVFRELAGDERRKTYVQHRGNFLVLGKEVSEGVPKAFHRLPEGVPSTRFTLAQWLTADDNPLTARVVANRFWEKIFGVGIVRTSEDFGTQGELPSHPELLDRLATKLTREQWDVRALLKLLVCSATYRQSSRVTSELLELDPDNRLLAHGPRFRMSAEMVRDQALFVSGLLSRKMLGPSVKPPQPKLGIKAAFGSAIDWKTSEGEDRYRRGIYTSWRRSNPYPSMAVFDAPNREVCTIRRDRTNTPLQALVTLNDPVYVEAAQALGRRMAGEGKTLREKVHHGFQLCLARPPDDEELDRLVQFYEAAYERFSKDPEKAQQMAMGPLSTPTPVGHTPAELAAWTVVGNVLLNLDEIFMKR